MVYEKVKEILIDLLQIDEDEISLDTPIVDLGADDIDLIEIAMDCEDKFDIELDDIEYEDTVEDLVKIIESKI